jgi:V8-like Glu-specific endopeptidase
MQKVATDVTGFITKEVLTRYKDEGFNFVRKVDYSKLNGIVRENSYTPSNGANLTSEVNSKSWLRLTSDGYEYYSIMSPVMDATVKSVDAFDPKAPDLHRSLKVIGVDTREKIDNTKVFPYRAIGALGYNPDNLICSGTVIAKSATLTAAHCLYDVEAGEWTPHTYFAPGRFRDTVINDPYGRWDADFMTVLKSYTESGLSQYDFGVVFMKKKNTKNYPKFVGEKVGYVGLANPSDFDDPLLDGSTITGYPGDLTGGKSQWTSGECESGIVDDNDNNVVGRYNCDTAGGMSGSSILGSDNKARGVHTHAKPKGDDFNGGTIFIDGNGIFETVLSWSDRLNPTNCPRSVLCPAITGVRLYKKNGGKCTNQCFASKDVKKYFKKGWKCGSCR